MYSTAATEDDYWQVGIRKGRTTSQSADDIIWNDADYDLYYRITDAEQERRKAVQIHVSDVRGLPVRQWKSEAVYQRTIGVADDNTGQLDKVIDNSKTWAVDQWKAARSGLLLARIRGSICLPEYRIEYR